MNDNHEDFLHQLREPPGPEFARGLSTRLALLASETTGRSGRTHWSSALHLSRRRAVLIGAGAGVLALAALGASLLLTGGSPAVSAEAMLDRAQAVPANTANPPTNYHMQATRRDVNGTSGATETWMRSGGYFRSEETTKDAAGRTVTHSGGVGNPARVWKFYTDNGQLYYVTVAIDPTAAASPRPGATPKQPEPMTLDAFLSKQCGTTRRQPDGVAANRPAYVIVVERETCKADAAKAAATGVAAPAIQPGQTTMWLDKETFLLLKSEMRDAGGQVVGRYQVTSLEFNGTIPDSIFTYTPPPGATLIQPPDPKPKPPPPATP